MLQKNSRKPSAYRSADNIKASILIVSLWAVFLLSFFAVILGYQMRQKLTVVRRLDDRDRLRLITQGCVKKAIMILDSEKDKEYSFLNDPWGNNEQLFRDIAIGDGFFTAGYDYTDTFTGETATRYGLIDEERKININTASMAILKRLFNIVLEIGDMESERLAACIVDWRDKDSQLSIPLGSAEDSYYRNLQYSYEAKDDLFEILEETLLVKGMTSTLLDSLRPYITVYGQGKVNINTASREALLALGLEDSIVRAIISFRQGKDGLEATHDDGFFKNASNIVPELSRIFNLSSSQLAKVTAISQQYLTTMSDHFMIKCSAYFFKNGYTMKTEAVFNRLGEILHWRET